MNLRSFFCSLAVTGTLAASALAHCQIPCGIYDDAARFKALAEHITTIEKSITEITALSGKDKLTPTEQNQLVRWVSNKESHANEFADIVTKYFLQQRIKPAPAGDAKAEAASAVHLKLLHQMLVGAMKCKQNADAATTASLKTALDAFEKAYNAK
ncbi:MAG: nickel superoxide dismutase [Verrucomicrobiales bacterium]|jgi:nickel superoxide dismutase